MRKILAGLILTFATALPALAQDINLNFKWVQASPDNPRIWYSISSADKQAGTVSLAVAIMRRAGNPATPGNTGSIRTEMILCSKGYEDTHMAVDGSMHAAPDSFQAFDFEKPDAMEVISGAVCPKG